MFGHKLTEKANMQISAEFGYCLRQVQSLEGPSVFRHPGREVVEDKKLVCSKSKSKGIDNYGGNAGFQSHNFFRQELARSMTPGWGPTRRRGHAGVHKRHHREAQGCNAVPWQLTDRTGPDPHTAKNK